jgi:hypothetical protein
MKFHDSLHQTPEGGEALQVVDPFEGVGRVLPAQLGVARPVIGQDRLAAVGEALVPQILDQVVEPLFAGREIVEGGPDVGREGGPPVQLEGQ